jgi:c-di-GMP-binding flagellar brake protein YcgR
MNNQTAITHQNTEKAEPLEDLLEHDHLFMPAGTDVQIEVGGVDFKLQSTIVGALSKQYIILKAPSSNNSISINTKLYGGNTVTVRYLYNGTVYGFQSTLLGSIKEPVKLIFVSYPKMIASRELRALKRLHCCIPSKTLIHESEYNTIIKDINTTGCRILLKYPSGTPRPAIEVGDTLSSMVQLFPGIKEHNLTGVVKNITIDKHTLHIGVQFNTIDEALKDNIQKYISLFSDL